MQFNATSHFTHIRSDHAGRILHNQDSPGKQTIGFCAVFSNYKCDG